MSYYFSKITPMTLFGGLIHQIGSVNGFSCGNGGVFAISAKEENLKKPYIQNVEFC